MSRYFSIALISLIALSISFGAVRKTKVPKNERMTYRMERDPSNYETIGRGSTKITMPNTRNGGFFCIS